MLETYLSINLAKEASEELVAIIGRYNEPHRHYHNTSHLLELLEAIQGCGCDAKMKLSLSLVAIFHDAVYDPRKKDNEEKSAELAEVFLSKIGLSKETQANIVQAILDTKNHHLAKTELSKQFCRMDLNSLLHGDFARLMSDEKKIFKEFQYVDVKTYKENREKFLLSFIENWTDPLTVSRDWQKKMHNYIDYVKAYVPKIAIYAGSFNPFHVGHLDVLEKAEKVFDKVIVAAGINSQKVKKQEGQSYEARIGKITGEMNTKDFLFMQDPDAFISRCQSLYKTLPVHEVIYFTTLLSEVVKYYRTMGEITVIRGLRNGFDLQAESNLVAVLKDIDPGCNVIYIPCSNDLSHVSSSVMRELIAFDATDKHYCVTKFDYLNSL